MAGNRRVLGIDQGSLRMGAAYLQDGRPIWTRAVSMPSAWSWRRRMTFSMEKLHADLFGGTLLEPDVIGVEDVALGVNVSTLSTMARTVGWTVCELAHWYPNVPIYLVHPATVRAGVEAPAKREGAIRRYHVIASHLLGRKVSDDEAAAVCIALATRSMTGEQEQAVE